MIKTLLAKHTSLLLVLSLFSYQQLLGQGLDCSDPISLCGEAVAGDLGNLIIEPTQGQLFTDAINPAEAGCIQPTSGVGTSPYYIWYTFTIDDLTSPNESFTFTLDSESPDCFADQAACPDIDFALYGPITASYNCSNLGTPLRCSSAGTTSPNFPRTGIRENAIPITEGSGLGENNGFVQDITVNPGEVYLLFIHFDNFNIGNTNPFSFTTNNPDAPINGELPESQTCCDIVPAIEPFSTSACNDATVVLDASNSFSVNGITNADFDWTSNQTDVTFIGGNTSTPSVNFNNNFTGTVELTLTITDPSIATNCSETIMVTLNVAECDESPCKCEDSFSCNGNSGDEQTVVDDFTNGNSASYCFDLPNTIVFPNTGLETFCYTYDFQAGQTFAYTSTTSTGCVIDNTYVVQEDDCATPISGTVNAVNGFVELDAPILGNTYDICTVIDLATCSPEEICTYVYNVCEELTATLNGSPPYCPVQDLSSLISLSSSGGSAITNITYYQADGSIIPSGLYLLDQFGETITVTATIGGCLTSVDVSVPPTLVVQSPQLVNTNITVCDGGSTLIEATSPAANYNFYASFQDYEDGGPILLNGSSYNPNTLSGDTDIIYVTNLQAVPFVCESVPVAVTVTVNALTTDINETYNGCAGDGYSVEVNGVTYNEGNATGTEILTDANGCNYDVDVTLTFEPLTADETETYTGCAGDGYSVEVNGVTYNESNATGTETLTDANGCNYDVDVTLTFEPLTPNDTETYTGCEGDGYSVVVNGVTYDESNQTGTETLTDGNGCDYEVDVALTFNPLTPNDTETYTGCEGDGYSVVVNGVTYNEGNPTGTETLTDGNGCNYDVDVTLTFEPLTADETETYTGCEGDGYSVVVNGVTYDESNQTGTETLTDGNGCDYEVDVALTFNPLTPNDTETYTGCEGDGYSVVVNGVTYNEGNPTGTETLTDGNGCNYDVDVTLTFNPLTPNDTETYTGCAGDGYSVEVNGVTYNEGNATGTETLTDANGCNYDVDVTLTFDSCVDPCDSVTDEIETYTGCAGDGYSVEVNGVTYNEGNATGTETLTDANGCNYDVDVTLTYEPLTADETETYTGCAGDGYSVEVNGVTYNEGNATGTETLQDGNNCDYTVTVALTYEPLTADINEVYTGCVGDGYSYTSPSGVVYDESNPTGTETLQDGNSCDYDVDVTLTYVSSVTGVYDEDRCSGDGYVFTLGGNSFDEITPSGTATIPSSGGCDSIVTVTLTYVSSVTGVYDEDRCSGDGYVFTLGGNSFDEITPSGTATIPSSGGCDSIVTVTLNYVSSVTGVYDEDRCSGDGYVFTLGGNSFDEITPSGTATIPSSGGCDSIVTVTLNYVSSVTGVYDEDRCSGDGYVFTLGGNSFDEITPSGTATIPSSGGCDSIVTVTLNYVSSVTGVYDEDRCSGDGYVFTLGGNSFDEITPSGTATIPSSGGCDSIVTVTLNYVSSVTGVYDEDRCSGDGYVFTLGGNSFDEITPSGTATIPSSGGCDSIVTVTLNYVSSVTGVYDEDRCSGDGYVFTLGGNSFDEITPSGTATIPSSGGCDSIVTVTLNYVSSVTGVYDEDRCSGDGYVFTLGGNSFDEITPSGTATIPSSGGCDSIVTVTLNYVSSVTGVYDEDRCSGDGYVFTLGGNSFDEITPSGTATIPSSGGCDSIVTVTLNYVSSVTGVYDEDRCSGDGYVFTLGGNSFDEITPSGTATIPSSGGCDSIVTVTLNYVSSVTGVYDEDRCSGDGYVFTLGGNSFDEITPSGTATIPSSGGCDSIVTVTLNYVSSVTSVYDEDRCSGDGYVFTLGGNSFDEITPSGTATIPSSGGCDSIITVTLNYVSSVTGVYDEDRCSGDGYVFTLGGNSFDEITPSGTATIPSSGGCDSIVTVTLNYVSSVTGVYDEDRCSGDGYVFTLGGNSFDEITPSGTATIPSSGGCDSIVTVTLNYVSSVTGVYDEDRCSGDGYVFTLGGNSFDEITPSGTATIPSSGGCDSIVTVTLNYVSSVTSVYDEDRCSGDGYVFTLGGNSFDEITPSGTATIPSSGGCDSIVTVTLNYVSSVTGVYDEDRCSGDGYVFTLGGNSFDEITPSGTATIPSSGGCDSIVTVTLNYVSSVTGVYDEDRCSGDGYVFTLGGNSFDEITPSGTATIPSSGGCDSIVTVTLNYVSSVTGVYDEDRCSGDGYVFTLGGNSFDEITPSGTATIPSSGGCDSIVTVTLNYVSSVTSVYDEDRCSGDGYVFTLGGNSFDEITPSGTATIPSSGGCDSIITVTLNYVSSVTGVYDEDRCSGDGYVFTLGGNSFDEITPSGTATIPSSGGCDSIVTVTLNYVSSVTGVYDEDRCSGDGYVFTLGGNSFDEITPSGTATIPSSGGCDSIVTVTLNYVSSVTGVYDEDRCSGDGYVFTLGGNSFDEITPSGTATIPSSGGCDSIVTVTLNYVSSVTGVYDEDRCSGDGYVFTLGGNSFDEITPSGTATIPSSGGCDSIVTVTLNYVSSVTSVYDEDRCSGDGYVFTLGGNSFDEITPSGTATIPSSGGCDSIVTVTLNYVSSVTGVYDEDRCSGDGYVFTLGGNSFDEITPSGTATIPSSGGCDSIVTVTLNYQPTPIINNVTPINPTTCSGTGTLELIVSNVPANPLIEITWDGGSQITSYSGSGPLTISPLSVQDYNNIQIEVDGCTSDLGVNTSIVAPLTPIANAGSDLVIGCNETSIQLDASLSSSGTDIQYSWINLNTNDATGIDNPLAQSPNVDVAGIYELTVTDTSNNCSSTDTVEVTQPTNTIIDFDFTTTDACFGESDGGFIITSVNSGSTAGYTFDIGNGFTSQTDYSGLPIGNYNVTVQDAVGCQYSDEVTVGQADEILFELGANQTVLPGTEITIIPESMPSSYSTISWITTSVEPLSCINCEEPTVIINTQTTFTATLVDNNGCVKTESITYFVDRTYDVPMPTAFSPNGDRINEVLYIGENINIESIVELNIYNRYGKRVFEQEPNATAGDPSVGWRGFYKDKKQELGVYVYYGIVRFNDGYEKQIKGNITLIR